MQKFMLGYFLAYFIQLFWQSPTLFLSALTTHKTENSCLENGNAEVTQCHCYRNWT